MEDSGNSTKSNVLLPKANVITLSYKESEIGGINSILEKIQVNHGIFAPTMKDLFHEILKIALNSLENPGSNSGVTTEQIQEIQEKFTEVVGINNQLGEEIQAKDAKIQELEQQLETLNSIDLEVSEIRLPFNPATGNIYIELQETQQQIINTIANNRFTKGYDTTLKSTSQIAELLIFNKGTLYNWGGEVFTGL